MVELVGPSCACGHELDPMDNYCTECGRPRDQIEQENAEAHDLDMKENVLAKEKKNER